MVGDSAFAGHQALGYRAAVEENNLIFLFTVVVVPVKHGGWLLTGQPHSTHGDGRTHVNFTGGGDASVIQLA